jgi:VIT1/CCC1 family predicted Fe2+/Mn2+ transporter
MNPGAARGCGASRKVKSKVNSLESWKEEMRSAYLYRQVALAERGTPREALFNELASAAEEQAQVWAGKAAKQGQPVPERYAPDARARLVAALVPRLGVRAMRGVLAAMKVRGMTLYHKAQPGHYLQPGVRDGEARHRGLAGGGNLRAAVFGMNDGLVSNASLILGVAGGTADTKLVLLSGVAGLLAGAFSMAAGEFVSVRSQREFFEYQIGLERDELDQYPDDEANELALIYAAKGVPKDQAERIARDLVKDPQTALDTLAREELGLNPDELGSPSGAALFSFLAFSAGALVPLLPFVFASGGLAVALAAVVTGVALFGAGAAISLFTGRAAWKGGLRMLGIGAAAGGLTYLIGSLLGVSLG